ncbi:MAG: dTDP-4-dehydrorhamnose reductase [Candidatus Xenobiia bacterium LiM19]
MRKCLILGSRGLLGSEMVRSAAADIELIPLTREDLDIRNRDDVFKAIENMAPDAVINCAGQTGVDDAENEVEKAFLVNAYGARYVAEACSRSGATIIYFSTDYVFDGRKAGHPYVEGDSPAPLNTYGLSKLTGEFFVRNASQNHYIVRTASLFGRPGTGGRGNNFVERVLEAARKGDQFTAVTDLVMSPTYTADLADAVWQLLKERPEYGIYHMANEGWCSWHDLACAVVKEAGLSAEITAIPQSELQRKARRPLWSPLATERNYHLRPWKDALKKFMHS